MKQWTKSQKKQRARLRDELEFLKRVPTMHPHLIRNFGELHYWLRFATARLKFEQLGGVMS